ncbi:hypothetical protein J8273_5276 [Carpediemonas membranifera]|uniref:Uncharacterized protein n=1 Tax=Carpediemonas membranifera TaxID=201153 RepID=A0A8J6E2T6_9EUKA|nr:hypothetical protein J8273_5276 [Carpediemonas membranifera]|eukprot:KAG9392287.1 hypothetical protein J8273_5276 [Carpediemonas membranifera]
MRLVLGLPLAITASNDGVFYSLYKHAITRESCETLEPSVHTTLPVPATEYATIIAPDELNALIYANYIDDHVHVEYLPLSDDPIPEAFDIPAPQPTSPITLSLGPTDDDLTHMLSVSCGNVAVVVIASIEDDADTLATVTVPAACTRAALWPLDDEVHLATVSGNRLLIAWNVQDDLTVPPLPEDLEALPDAHWRHHTTSKGAVEGVTACDGQVTLLNRSMRMASTTSRRKKKVPQHLPVADAVVAAHELRDSTTVYYLHGISADYGLFNVRIQGRAVVPNPHVTEAAKDYLKEDIVRACAITGIACCAAPDAPVIVVAGEHSLLRCFKGGESIRTDPERGVEAALTYVASMPRAVSGSSALQNTVVLSATDRTPTVQQVAMTRGGDGTLFVRAVYEDSDIRTFAVDDGKGICKARVHVPQAVAACLVVGRTLVSVAPGTVETLALGSGDSFAVELVGTTTGPPCAAGRTVFVPTTEGVAVVSVEDDGDVTLVETIPVDGAVYVSATKVESGIILAVASDAKMTLFSVCVPASAMTILTAAVKCTGPPNPAAFAPVVACPTARGLTVVDCTDAGVKVREYGLSSSDGPPVKAACLRRNGDIMLFDDVVHRVLARPDGQTLQDIGTIEDIILHGPEGTKDRIKPLAVGPEFDWVATAGGVQFGHIMPEVIDIGIDLTPAMQVAVSGDWSLAAILDDALYVADMAPTSSPVKSTAADPWATVSPASESTPWAHTPSTGQGPMRGWLEGTFDGVGARGAGPLAVSGMEPELNPLDESVSEMESVQGEGEKEPEKEPEPDAADVPTEPESKATEQPEIVPEPEKEPSTEPEKEPAKEPEPEPEPEPGPEPEAEPVPPSPKPETSVEPAVPDEETKAEPEPEPQVKPEDKLQEGSQEAEAELTTETLPAPVRSDLPSHAAEPEVSPESNTIDEGALQEHVAEACGRLEDVVQNAIQSWGQVAASMKVSGSANIVGLARMMTDNFRTVIDRLSETIGEPARTAQTEATASQADLHTVDPARVASAMRELQRALGIDLS